MNEPEINKTLIRNVESCFVGLLDVATSEDCTRSTAEGISDMLERLARLFREYSEAEFGIEKRAELGAREIKVELVEGGTLVSTHPQEIVIKWDCVEDTSKDYEVACNADGAKPKLFVPVLNNFIDRKPIGHAELISEGDEIGFGMSKVMIGDSTFRVRLFSAEAEAMRLGCEAEFGIDQIHTIGQWLKKHGTKS